MGWRTLVTVTTPARRFTPDQVRRRRTMTLRASVAVFVVVGLLFVVVFPVRAWMDQRAALDRSQHQLEVLQREQRRLTDEAKRLADPQEIERLARARYGMVRHGEQAYSVVATPTSTTTPPGAP
jgi:cell division protein FtsB